MSEGKPPDIGEWIGEGYYPWPQDFIKEALRQGISRDIAKGSIPEFSPGETYIAFIHPKAIVEVTAPLVTLHDLAREMILELTEEFITQEQVEKAIEEHYIVDGQPTLQFPAYLGTCSKAERHRLESKYKIVYKPGWFGMAPLTGVQLVASSPDDELPPDLAAKGVEIVWVEYEEETERE